MWNVRGLSERANKRKKVNDIPEGDTSAKSQKVNDEGADNEEEEEEGKEKIWNH